MTSKISFSLNGRTVTSAADPGTKLLDVLRQEFAATEVKCGCKEGECGACSVLIDGAVVNSCLVALGAVRNRQVLTIVGFAKVQESRYQALQQAFGEVSAVQCGYCIPGMILAAESLLNKKPHPTMEEIREGISGNLCRCTGYNAIARAIQIAAEKGAGLW